MADPGKYHLRVTAGPSYDTSTHSIVPVNTTQSTSITSAHLTSSLSVRIQNYHGLPPSSPSTCAYFSQDPHKNDLYSISFSFRLKEDINGADLIFGNDFDKPIKDRLPPGFGTALRIVKWAIDPGLDGDVYVAKPFLYGPFLSSINVLRVGEMGEGEIEEGRGDEVIMEGAEGDSAEEIREEAGVPADGPKRMKHFLDEKHRKAWTFEKGRVYSCDFFNPYLDFNDLALRLPGITLHLMRFWDGQPLRYVLKHKNADVDEPLIVIVFSLIPEEELEEEEKKMEEEDKKMAKESSKGEGETKAEEPKVEAKGTVEMEQDEID